MNDFNDKWYKEGLKFSCQGCGECCKGPGGYVWISDEEIQGMADKVNLSVKKFMSRYVRLVSGKKALIDSVKGDCIFLDDQGRCELYEQRPEQCKTFPWWPEIVRSKDTWENNGYDCPGIGHGTLNSIEIIEKGLQEHINNKK